MTTETQYPTDDMTGYARALCDDCASDNWPRREYHGMLPGFCTGCGEHVINGDVFGVLWNDE